MGHAMAVSLASSVAQARVSAFDAEAQQLAVWLRTRRFSALVGAAGTDRTALLRDGVLPLLRRRAGDVPTRPTNASPVVIPFPERRRRGFGAAGNVEVAVLFDAWRVGAPLGRLLAYAHAALGLAPPEISAEARVSLGGSFAGLGMQSGARFLLILDRFEECLRAAENDAQARDFIDELVLALNRPLLPLHVLVCASDDVAGPLAELFARVPGTDEHALRLGEEAEAAAASVEAAAAPAAPLSDAEWLASIGAIVARVADAARQGGGEAAPEGPANEVPAAPAASRSAAVSRPVAPAADDADPAVRCVDIELDLSPMPASTLPSMPAPALSPPAGAGPWMASFPAAEPPQAGAEHGTPISVPPIRWSDWLGAAAAGIVAAYFVWPARQDNARPAPAQAIHAPAPTPIAEAPLQPSATPAPPRTGVRDEVRADIERELAAALADGAASPAGPVWPPGFNPVPGRPSLAFARYDALQTARASGSPLPLQIVAPLHREVLEFIVRADSPMTYVHDMHGAAVNVGPAGSARALTAETALRRLFGAPPAPSPAAALDADAALGALLGGHGVDVLVMVEPPSSSWLTRLPAATGRVLRLLKLDPARPESRRALQAFLPLTLPAGAGFAADTPSLGEMSFLVAADDAEAGRAAASLCRQLPALQSHGAPGWRELSPGQVLPTGWPASPAAQQAWRDCRAASR
jgi:hypothetical protein